MLADAEQIINRMLEVVGTTNQSAMMRTIGGSPEKLAMWKRRNRVPDPQINLFCRTHNVRKEWLVHGLGEMRNESQTVNEAGDTYNPGGTINLETEVATITSVFRELTPEDRLKLLVTAVALQNAEKIKKI